MSLGIIERAEVRVIVRYGWTFMYAMTAWYAFLWMMTPLLKQHSHPVHSVLETHGLPVGDAPTAVVLLSKLAPVRCWMAWDAFGDKMFFFVVVLSCWLPISWFPGVGVSSTLQTAGVPMKHDFPYARCYCADSRQQTYTQ